MEIIKPDKEPKQKRFMRLYEPSHSRLCRFVQTLVWNSDDAKDIIGETALIAFEKFDMESKPETFVFFLFGIASRLVKNKSRRNKFRGVFQSDEVQHKAVPALADENLMKKELHLALGKLPEKQREAIVLFEISGFSIKEIAEMNRQSESAIKSSLKRGREQLVRLLADTLPQSASDGITQISKLTERSSHGK